MGRDIVCDIGGSVGGAWHSFLSLKNFQTHSESSKYATALALRHDVSRHLRHFESESSL